MAFRRVQAALAEAAMKHVPFGAPGSGFYSDATRGCFDVMARMSGLAKDAVENALEYRARNGAAHRGEVFRLLDLGTADAGTSLALVRDIIIQIRETEPAAPIEVIYEDQPGNDWASVFARTQGTIQTEGLEPGQALSDLENVYVLASGTSFYHPAASPGTVDVAICATAMHWLSNAPQAIPDALHSACTQDSATSAAFAEQADHDWVEILLARARELKTGGGLVVANFCVDDGGQFLGRSHRVQNCMHNTFADIWSDLCTPEEFHNTNFPNQYRSLACCAAPFEREGGSFAGMNIVSADTDVVPCPFLDSWLARTGPGDPIDHAARYVPTTRTWSNSTFVAGLSDSRTQEEKHELVDELFRQYEQHVAADPENHGMDYVHSYLHIQKSAS